MNSRSAWAMCLLASSLVSACVDVPEPTPVGGDAADVDGTDGPRADAEPTDVGDVRPPVDASATDVGADMDLDMAPPDAVVTDVGPDQQPPDTLPPDLLVPDMLPPDLAVVDAAVEPDQGLPEPLMFSNCLALSNAAGPQPPQQNDTPCVQVAVATPLPERLSWAKAVPLADGRVVVVGGLRSDAGGGQALATVYVYDPALNSWEAGPDMPEGRWGHAAERLEDEAGNEAIVVLGGGSDTGGAPWSARASAALWAVDTPFWNDLDDLQPPVSESASWSDGNQIWLVGGHGGPRAAPTNTTSLWNAAGETGVNLGTLIEPRYGHVLVGVAGSVMAIGGANAAQQSINSAELHGENGWTRIGSDLLRRVHAAAIVVGDRVVVAGGRNVALDYNAGAVMPERLADTVVISQSPGVPWEANAGRSMYRARFAFGFEPIGAQARHALAIGGEASGADEVIVELFDTARGEWTPLTLPPPADRIRTHHATAQLADGTVFVAGGVWGDAPAGSPELFMDQVLIFRTVERDVAVPDGVP